MIALIAYAKISIRMENGYSKILVVEDEIVTRNTLKGIFEAEGYDVFEAENGVEMHHILTNHNINLVVMDINLPGKTAYYWQENSVKN